MENPPFDPNKPTVVYFGGGDCFRGGGAWLRSDESPWAERANIISSPFYEPDLGGELPTYYHCGDLLVVTLSEMAPDYQQPIQTMGYSTGGQPAIDVGIRCNDTYCDRRYAVNRVTFFDATGGCRSVYADSINTFLASSVDGEQCWVDNYVSTLLGVHNPVAYDGFQLNVLNVGYNLSLSSDLSRDDLHGIPIAWYVNSLTREDMNQFNRGIIGGAYWSVIGPGKNLQLASTPGLQVYRFRWFGDENGGWMDFHDVEIHPGRLPEPVTLLEPLDVGDPNGWVFTCAPSENAVGYELLFGSDPFRVMDYLVVSDTSVPPEQVIETIPFADTWWTVRVHDAFGSTIYADPIRVDLESIPIVTAPSMTVKIDECNPTKKRNGI